MEFDKIKYYTEKKILTINFEKDIPNNAIGKIIELKKSGRNIFLEYEEKYYKIETDKNTEAYIENLLERKRSYIANLMDYNTIIILEYNDGKDLNLPILYDEKIKNKKKKKNNSIVQELEKEFILPIRAGIGLILFGLKKLETKDEYILIGEKEILYLERKEKDYFKDNIKLITEVFIINKREKLTLEKFENFKIFLFKGKIEFLDDSKKVRESYETKIILEEINKDSSSYLKVWEKYTQTEKEYYEEKARLQGEFQIKKSTYNKLENKKEVIDLELNKKCSFEEGDSVEIIKNSEEKYDAQVERESNGNKLRIFFKTNFPKSFEGWTLKGSIKGNEAMFERRERAKNLILNDRAAMNLLPLIIEGKKAREKRKEYLAPLSSQTKRELFPKYDPTENQKKAIEIALNTPDIALIQGPPGTGKTTVITAILKRLGEEKKEVGNIAGNNLITSFQHDAVINATARIKNLGGIPAEKYGQKITEQDETVNKIFKNYIINALNEYYNDEPQLKKRKEEEELLELYSYYKKKIKNFPLKTEVIIFLQKLYEFVIKYSIPNIEKEILKLQLELTKVNIKKIFIEKKYFYKLPIYKEMIEDDGKIFIEKSLEILKKEINNKEILEEDFKEEIKFLEISLNSEDINFLVMKRCRNSILSKLKERDIPFLENISNEKIEEIFEKINLLLEKIQENSKDYINDIKIRYLRELENNPLRVRDTLRAYMSTYGATCQQAQGKRIKEAKNKGEKIKESKIDLKDFEKYENILIDEAARSNPPDLLIPMSMAKERIIFVGDHKQLPHLVDETIVEKISENSKNVKEEYNKRLLEESMFEVLIKKCKELEKIDGMKRVLMLDTQYRMHPKMGEFISENFYENKLKSGLDADKFQTLLQGLEGKAFVWYDIPYKKEFEETTRNNSKVRHKEAKEIAKFIYRHIDSEKTKGKNFGIITFYREQVNEIYKELSNKENLAYEGQSLVVEKQKNEYIISNKYSNLGYEKLRIGSVDSFQGMEFNYVCLSMVRSNQFPLNTESDVRRKFGFLTNPNRLCVAMSRQKELLIMFGDSSMLEKEEFEDIKPLQKFLRMCKEEREYGEFKSIL